MSNQNSTQKTETTDAKSKVKLARAKKFQSDHPRLTKILAAAGVITVIGGTVVTVNHLRKGSETSADVEGLELNELSEAVSPTPENTDA